VSAGSGSAGLWSDHTLSALALPGGVFNWPDLTRRGDSSLRRADPIARGRGLGSGRPRRETCVRQGRTERRRDRVSTGRALDAEPDSAEPFARRERIGLNGGRARGDGPSVPSIRAVCSRAANAAARQANAAAHQANAAARAASAAARAANRRPDRRARRLRTVARAGPRPESTSGQSGRASESRFVQAAVAIARPGGPRSRNGPRRRRGSARRLRLELRPAARRMP